MPHNRTQELGASFWPISPRLAGLYLSGPSSAPSGRGPEESCRFLSALCVLGVGADTDVLKRRSGPKANGVSRRSRMSSDPISVNDVAANKEEKVRAKPWRARSSRSSAPR
jgi:hypothetical protein